MSNHIYNIRRPLPATLEMMVEKYNEGLAAGFTEAKAKRYACHVAERQRQDSGGYRGRVETYKDWPAPTATVCTYDRLVLGKRIQPGFIRAMREAWDRSATMQCGQLARKAIVNLGNIFHFDKPGWGQNDKGAEIWFLRHSVLRYDTPLRGWAAIERGRDLFIKGLGGFDIHQTVSKLDMTVTMRGIQGNPLPGVNRRKWVQYEDPRIIQFYGYWFSKWGQGGSVLAPALPTNRGSLPIPNWFMVEIWLRHQDWFVRNHQWVLKNRNSLDEVLHAQQWEYRWDWHDDPEVQLGKVREAADEYRAKLDRKGAEREKLLMAKVFDPMLPTKEVELNGTPMVLRSVADAKELKRVGQRLHNCAFTYVDSIKAGQQELVALWQGEKPLALAELGERGKNVWVIRQLSAHCNQNCSAEVDLLFGGYVADVNSQLAKDAKPKVKRVREAVA